MANKKHTTGKRRDAHRVRTPTRAAAPKKFHKPKTKPTAKPRTFMLSSRPQHPAPKSESTPHRPSAPREPVTPPLAARELLFQKGQVRGFITETEILYAFQEFEEYVEFLEEFLDTLQERGVQVVETGGEMLGKREEHQALLGKPKDGKSREKSYE
ncbi:hypothetical protein HY632_01825, partial [Candidatus Uhrbacteria bacterium]|nr:hypothetical protein [Candidatus Uhrbacteria bacterium]